VSSQTVSAELALIAERSECDPDKVFTALAHHMDVAFLEEAYHGLRRKAAAGIDQVTVADYRENLGENLKDLHRRLVTKQYRAQPAKRAYIPKSDGKKRPLAILVLEDKIVQRAVSMLLSAVYEPMFYDFSYAFRRKRSAHQAIAFLREQCRKLNIKWIVDADIRGYFDNIDRERFREVLRSRVNDGSIIRLIGKWFHAGVLEEGEIQISEKGVPQGGVVSPVLSNIFLHTVLDDWFAREVQPRLRGRSFIVRFADDFVVGFELKSDAERFYKVLPKRMGRFGLEIHPDKSRLVQFSRPGKGSSKGSGTFDFLSFTHYWGKTLKGGWSIKRKTKAKRLRQAMVKIEDWCKSHKHQPIREQYQKLCSKLRGHYQYYGIRGNYKMLEVFYEHTRRVWKYWLGRRSNGGYTSWEVFENRIGKYFPLPKPRIVHTQ
jgi:RNA-directed DNA polymerase